MVGSWDRDDLIEPLGEFDRFECHTPFGVFRMTKGEFYPVFPNVVRSISYAVRGLYNYKVVPSKAVPFLVRE